MQEKQIRNYKPTDLGAGELFADYCGEDVRYIAQQNTYLLWDGKRWAEDTTENINEIAKRLAAETMPALASKIESDEQRQIWLSWASKLHSNRNRREMLISARSLPGIATTLDSFDKHQRLINFQNGVLDLNTGQFVEHNRLYMLSKITNVNYDPKANCERWNRFVLEVMDGRQDLARFLQKAVGYSIAGNPVEDCMFIAIGASTRNGKSTFYRAILNVLGDYASTARPETIALNRSRTGNSANSDLARLKGVRFVNLPEPGKGLELDAALIKTLTGRDPIPARFLHREFFEFIPQFALHMVSNYLPRCDDLTLFNSNRIFAIPFDVHFPPTKQDTHLLEQFAEPEASSAIFNWVYDGYQMYMDEGLKNDVPEAIQATVNEYEANSDTFGQFIKDCISPVENTWTQVSTIYKVYEVWCRENGHHAMSNKNMAAEFRRRGYKDKRMTPGHGFNDVMLNNDLPNGWRVS